MVSNGSVMLMPKEESYLLRNVGKADLELLVIELRKWPGLRRALSVSIHIVVISPSHSLTPKVLNVERKTERWRVPRTHLCL